MEKKWTKKDIIIYIIISAVCVLGIIYAMVSKNKATSPITSENQRYQASFFDVFDTETVIIGYAKTEEDFTELVQKLKDELSRYNDLYDIYHSYEGINNIKTINENAGKEAVKVDREIIDLLKFSIELYSNTKGQTNIAMGSLLSIWHSYRTLGIEEPDKASLPSEYVLKRAAEHMDITKIIIDEENSTVYLADPGMSLDVGSIGKGYAVQKLAEYAKELGVKNMLLSVGGNICTIGAHEDGTPWKLGVQNPDMESSQTYVARVKLQDGYCIVTSGDYQRYYIAYGKKYCHIIDPDTLYPAEGIASVSIITNNSGAADALSTAVFCMSVEEGLEYINNMPGVEALWVLHDGSIIYSDKMKEYLVED